jgi:hypothetical protein
MGEIMNETRKPGRPKKEEPTIEEQPQQEPETVEEQPREPIKYVCTVNCYHNKRLYKAGDIDEFPANAVPKYFELVTG